jgi:hypothetical protein
VAHPVPVTRVDPVAENTPEGTDMGIAGNMSNILDKSSGTSPASASPGDRFPSGYPTITASDASNAAKLGPLGFVAKPATAWTTGQKITVNGFDFNWSGTAWAAGAHAAEDPDPEVFDPANYTVDEVKDYVVEHDQTHEVISMVLAKERAGKNRATLVHWLEELLD